MEEDVFLDRLLALFEAIRGGEEPKCACCELGLFIGGHVCPPAVIEYRRAHAMIADARVVR